MAGHKAGRLGTLAAILLVGLHPQAGSPHELSAELREAARIHRPDDEVAVLIRLRNALDLRALRRESEQRGEAVAVRRAQLVRSLTRRAARSSGSLRRMLRSEGVKSVQVLWIHNGLALELPVRLLERVANHPDVESMRLDAVVQMAEPIAVLSAPAGWNLEAVGAPSLWDAGYTGQGVVLANVDTGVDALHPDVGPKQRPANSWFDPYGEHVDPYDPTGHGTQSLGLILGGENSGQAIGMAPDAQWIAVKIFNDAGDGMLSRMHVGYQWLLDPDGDPETDDLPDIVNNSWTLNGIDECDPEFAADVAALQAADVAVVFSAGNFGPSPSTSVSPANNDGAMAVGAVDALDNVATFSARGPSACNQYVYPDLVAPGVNLYTADLTLGGIFPDSYVNVTGTSFSAPLVSGALALLRSAHPLASLAHLESALLNSTLDLGSPGADNDSGWGRLDVWNAHQMLVGREVPALAPRGRVLEAVLLFLAGALALCARPSQEENDR